MAGSIPSFTSYNPTIGTLVGTRGGGRGPSQWSSISGPSLSQGLDVLPFHGAEVGAHEVDTVITATAILKVNESKSEQEKEVGEEQLLFINSSKGKGSDGGITRILGHTGAPYEDRVEAKSLSRLNLFLRSDEGRRRYPTDDSKELVKDWKMWGFQRDPTRMTGSQTAIVGQRVRTFDYWIIDGRPVHDTQYLWLILVRKRDGPPPIGQHAAPDVSVSDGIIGSRKRPIGAVPDMSSEYKTQAELKKKADEDAKIGITRTSDGISSSPGGSGRYWCWIPVKTNSLVPPAPTVWCNEAFIGSYLYVGRVVGVLMGEENLAKKHQKTAEAALFPEDTSDAHVAALMKLPKIEIHFRIK